MININEVKRALKKAAGKIEFLEGIALESFEFQKIEELKIDSVEINHIKHGQVVRVRARAQVGFRYKYMTDSPLMDPLFRRVFDVPVQYSRGTGIYCPFNDLRRMLYKPTPENTLPAVKATLKHLGIRTQGLDLEDVDIASPAGKVFRCHGGHYLTGAYSAAELLEDLQAGVEDCTDPEYADEAGDCETCKGKN